MRAKIAGIRKNYSKKKLTESKANPDPFKQFTKWWKQALASEIAEPNAMTLATASADGIPSARIVLLKGFDERGFVFFTNYESYKGKQIEENPRGCIVFFWKELERQVRITGIIEKIDSKESEEYFHSRPEGSQIGAAVSPQSRIIESRDWLDEQYKILKKELKGKVVPRPANWGGYLLKPVLFEFWQGRPSRLHDRLQYTPDNNAGWKIERLAP